MERSLMRKAGACLLVVGAILIVLGEYGLNTIMFACPANGCSSAVLWNAYGPYEVMLWSGVVIVVVGAVMLVLSFLTPKIVSSTLV
jgi:hypothetical protein